MIKFTMKRRIEDKLLKINKDFYSRIASDFSRTRQSFWPGWKTALNYMRLNELEEIKIFDVGCGNGRFYDFLKSQHSKLDYLGIDNTPELFPVIFPENESIKFKVIDIINDDLRSLNNEPYDLISMIAVLHHIPGKENRLKLMSNLKNLLRDNGYLLITFWDFLDETKLVDKIVDWKYTDIDTKDLDNGDYLISWGGDKNSYRYCHYYSQNEKNEIINFLDLNLIKTFKSDGKSGSLNSYYLLQNS